MHLAIEKCLKIMVIALFTSNFLSERREGIVVLILIKYMANLR